MTIERQLPSQELYLDTSSIYTTRHSFWLSVLCEQMTELSYISPGFKASPVSEGPTSFSPNQLAMARHNLAKFTER